jgi:hypothetical protein
MHISARLNRTDEFYLGGQLMARCRLSIHAIAYSKAAIEYCIQELI